MPAVERIKPIIKMDAKLKVAAYCRVSTEDEDQLNSLKSQKDYYESYIKNNKDWSYAGIYSDEAITGTKASIRPGFQKMIEDALNNKIQFILTKSISRFGRNTLDVLTYVRKLKEKNVAVFFEEENINTLTMDGELMLTVLSSVAQQEINNTSEHIKAGFKMKISRGELIGNCNAYGYYYSKEDKQIHINEEEAKIVRYIFEQYAKGYGSSNIAKDLTEKQIKTRKGNTIWQPKEITAIIRNEKYIGDCLFGKTLTIDPISKKRMQNDGQGNKYYISEHHEAIISKELYEEANKVLDKRSATITRTSEETILDFTGKYIFSKKIICGYCGASYTRRHHNQSTSTMKYTWKCITQVKRNVSYCPEAKCMDEDTIKEGFVFLLSELKKTDKNILLSLISSTQKQLETATPKKNEYNIKQAIKALEYQKSKALDGLLDGTITKENYAKKTEEMDRKLAAYQKELNEMEGKEKKKTSIDNGMASLVDSILSSNNADTYDESQFEGLVKSVIIGGYKDLVSDPYMLTFLFSKNHKEKKEETSMIVFKTMEMPKEFYTFKRDDAGINQKQIHKSITIRAAIEGE